MSKDFTIGKISDLLKKKEVSAKELIGGFLVEVEKKEGDVHAFINIFKESAIKQAEEVDKKIAKGEEIGPLAGVPCAIKDNILVKGEKCTAGSKVLENYVASYDASVVEKLKRAGAIILGKTNMDEFAMGSSTENSAFGPSRNPLDLELVPGGSSGGSAAAVAAGECVFALGSETGGSVRQPAAFCDIFGLKPTYGSVSRYGLMAMASSLDQVGVLSRDIEDVEKVFDVIKGCDVKDATSREPLFMEPKMEDISKLKIGLIKECFELNMHGDIRKDLEKAVDVLKGSGIKIEEVSIPSLKYSLPAYYIIMPAEISSNLARYDGIRYGLFPDGDAGLADYYSETRKKGFGREVKRRIILGSYILSAGHYDAYYVKAQKIRSLLKEEFKRAFEKADILMLPTVPTPPFKFGQKIDDPVEMYLSDIFTVAANLTGLPAFAFKNVQFVGDYFEEKIILNMAKYYEKLIA